MRLSIVVGTHNEGKRLLKTIGSIVETAGDLEYELVVSDDASSDGSHLGCFGIRELGMGRDG